MENFEKIIGYDAVKNALDRVLDQMLHPEVYREIGVTETEKGILLYGSTGTGKTTLAMEFIGKTGRKSYIVRKTKKQPDMLDYVNAVFEEAKRNAPSIILLDDMDGWANSDDTHQNTEEYRLVQSLIDESKDDDIYIVATCNQMRLLPVSLLRPGRFGIRLCMNSPTPADAQAIVRHYLGEKKLEEGIDLDDIAKAVDYSSCAELEFIVKKAGINAAYARRSRISRDDILSAVVSRHYDEDDDDDDYCANVVPEAQMMALCRHEAGHALIAELLRPGCVGIASVRAPNRGFIHLCTDVSDRNFKICVSLAGKAAVELYRAEPDAGSGNDLHRAMMLIHRGMNNGLYGFSMLDFSTNNGVSDSLNCRQEQFLNEELERWFSKVKEMLLENQKTLDEMARELMEKKVLLFSDIQRIMGAR